VTKLSFVPAHKDKAEGFRATLSCALCRWYDSCGKGQEQAVQFSRERTTLLACLQELRKRLQDRHGFRCAQSVAKKAAADAQAAAAVHTPSVLEAMMLFQETKKHAQTAQDRAKAAQDQVKASKKVALEAEKDNDAAQKESVKGILSSYSFLFLGTPGHYCIRKYSCWCKPCSLVCGRGYGCVSRHKFLDVPGCLRSKLTVWKEE
jgi:hypothetical protein